MSNYHLFQFHLSAQALSVLNDYGWGADHAEIKAFRSSTHLDDPVLAISGGFYSHVSDIRADTVDGAFDYGNIGPESRITRHAPMRSPSVGDVFLSDQGEAFFCLGVGWKQLSHEESLSFWQKRVDVDSASISPAP